MNLNLCNDIETALGRQIKTPKDFDFLRERIYARLHILVSRTTLMRLWGYLQEDVEPREGTLDILARFLGYKDWGEYQQNALLPMDKQSNPIMSRRISVATDLCCGERLRLTWQPQRICDVEYLGDNTFKVEASEKTRLRAGDTFQCSMVIEGEPLYLDNLCQSGRPPIAYVCGKKNGVLFEYIL